MNITDEERQRRRREKFSNATTLKIKNDLLKDTSLLSRTTTDSNSNINSLINDPMTRLNYLDQLEGLSNSHNGTDTTISLEHGLRKLREVIIKIYYENYKDGNFVTFVKKVYFLSYKYFISSCKINELGGTILSFLYEHRYELDVPKEYIDVYHFYTSHFQKNLGKFMQEIAFNPNSSLVGNDRIIMRMALTYVKYSSCPSFWFQSLESYSEDSLVYEFLTTSGIKKNMQIRCIDLASKCYNQLSLDFFKERWLGNTVLDPVGLRQLNDIYLLETRNNGHQTIIFRKKNATPKAKQRIHNGIDKC
ncbi:uncharacterized protein NDAI_0D03660 [Naumovozyma dairenensis CBS 421]|uniref:Uncharacterized protein n=1 Tax=Naumovozyma dairenensis (strain ATCC 10597 / BCRC 20456 / CBS 421 / NBRC 0211 / NRRL Y-12639) TaxID=1071378 RepID=G0WA69_NAUDC|nr:hypothetical protein NDAI_0D03660 [Naumovozyma dairenensis CBS 421]CCD24680.1 hypothetical protein NDAI_0D03660 [Naumovozyma dairenensis CBS 421]